MSHDGLDVYVPLAAKESNRSMIMEFVTLNLKDISNVNMLKFTEFFGAEEELLSKSYNLLTLAT